MQTRRCDVVSVLGWLISVLAVGVFWWAISGLMVKFVEGMEPPVPVSRSEVAEGEREPGLWVIGEGDTHGDD